MRQEVIQAPNGTEVCELPAFIALDLPPRNSFISALILGLTLPATADLGGRLRPDNM